MKNYKLNYLLSIISVLILSFMIVEPIYCQPIKKPRPEYYNKINPDYVKPEPVVEIDTVKDRDLFIDLEKLSRIAIIDAAGTEGANIDGTVILGIRVDPDGSLVGMLVIETTNKVLSPIATNALRKYFKKYKPKPAKKDGECIQIKEFLVPIVFDMSVLEKKRQPIEGTYKK